MRERTTSQMTAQPEATPDEELVTISQAKQLAANYILSHLPEDPDVGGDCETCRVIKGMAAGLLGQTDGDGDGQV